MTTTAVSADVTNLPKRESGSVMDVLPPLDDNINRLLEHFYDDDTIKALDFPMEDIDANDEDWNTQLQGLEPYYESSFQYHVSNSVGGTSGVTSITTHGRSSIQTIDQKHTHLVPSHSPVSVLNSQSESQSSGLAQHLRPLEPNFMNIRATKPSFVNPVKKKRTQCRRAHPANFSHRFTFPCASTDSSVSEKFYRFETFLTEELLNPEKRRQRKKNPAFQEADETKQCVEQGENRETKRCTHCAVTKTPQWREGPLGPKTLCNACGVRYRSGRLFPEYRPAASPTFVPAVHSNSHKKVIELRTKGCKAS